MITYPYWYCIVRSLWNMHNRCHILHQLRHICNGYFILYDDNVQLFFLSILLSVSEWYIICGAHAIQMMSPYLDQWWLDYWSIYAPLCLNEFIVVQVQYLFYSISIFSLGKIYKSETNSEIHLLIYCYLSIWCVLNKCKERLSVNEFHKYFIISTNLNVLQ